MLKEVIIQNVNDQIWILVNDEVIATSENDKYLNVTKGFIEKYNKYKFNKAKLVCDDRTGNFILSPNKTVIIKPAHYTEIKREKMYKESEVRFMLQTMYELLTHKSESDELKLAIKKILS
jgi:hypothetical protein